MMSLSLTGKLPFKQVLLHAMVRDAHGKKMSKSLGNVIDPIDVIEGVTLNTLHSRLLDGNLDEREIQRAKKTQQIDFPDGIQQCGTDALRFALLNYTTQARDINLDIKRVVGYRNFCNKIWNACKYSFSKFSDKFKVDSSDAAFIQKLANALNEAQQDQLNQQSEPNVALAYRCCSWILHRLNVCATLMNQHFASYDFNAVTTAIYNFWLYDYCDVFLECTKVFYPRLTISSNAAQDMSLEADKSNLLKEQTLVEQTLFCCMDAGLRLLSPIMPFLTEELYQRLPRHVPLTDDETICLAAYPEPDSQLENPNVEQEMDQLMRIVRVCRSLKADYLKSNQPAHGMLLNRVKHAIDHLVL